MEKMKEVDLWMAELRKIWEDRFDHLDEYLEKIQKKKKKK